MSSHNQTTSETTLLLEDPRIPGQSNSILSRERHRFSPETLLIPVALATKLASVLPHTTLLEILRLAVCKLWNVSHGDPATLLADGSISPALCDAPEVATYFSTIIAILGVTEGIVSMFMCGILSRISSRYGRRPAFLLIIITGIMGTCLMVGSQSMPDWISPWVFVVGMLIELCTAALPCDYLSSTYIADVCDPEDRTAALSKIAGWTMLGGSISYYLGGSITTKTGNSLVVFYIAAALFASTFIYVVFILPESFPEEKRDALSHTRQEASTDGPPTTTLFKSFLLIFEPLKMFIPTHSLNGTRNWRLTWCAAHTFVFNAAHSYVTTAWLVLATSKYHLTPADTGLFLTMLFVSCTIALAGIVPLLVSLLRPHYTQKTTRIYLEEEDMGNGEQLEARTSDYLNVHLAIVSCVITAIFYLVAASTEDLPLIIISAICIGFSNIHDPTVRSLVAGSVDPLKQGEALAANEMVSGAGSVLSPIIMGSVLSATISTAPLLTFYLHLVAVLISSGILFLVRDADRYQKANES
ncbi:major facilitator superfamily domain-containing protein [Chiua virens]|nr:major facilitator superfamily domain-containing protein [Chiua virens]